MDEFMKIRGFCIPPDHHEAKYEHLQDKFSIQRPFIMQHSSWRLFEDCKPVFSDANMALDLLYDTKESGYVIIVSVRNTSQHSVGRADIEKLMNTGAQIYHTILILSRLCINQRTLYDLCTMFAKPKKNCFFGEILYWHEVLIPKLNCRLVPTYRVLTESEVKEKETATCTSRVNFPPFFPNDAIVRYLGFRIGDVVYSNDTKMYRLVG